MAMPYGYEAKQTKAGRFYFVDHTNKITTWVDPRPLPHGWDKKKDKAKNKAYYVDHIRKKTQWQDPRPPPKMPPPKKPVYGDENKMPIEYAVATMTQGRAMLCSRNENRCEKKLLFCTNLTSSRGGKLYLCSDTERREEERFCYAFSDITDIYVGNRPSAILPKRGFCFSIQTRTQILDLEIDKDRKDDYTAFIKGFEQMKRPVTTMHRGKFSTKSPSVSSSLTKPVQKVPKSTKISDTDNREMELEWYKDVLKMALLDRNISKAENDLVEKTKKKLNISETEHSDTLGSFGWSLPEYHDVNEEKNPHHEIPDYTKKECCVCLDAEATYIILDCMHLCLCGTCASLFTPGKDPCPSCRKDIRDVRQTFS